MGNGLSTIASWRDKGLSQKRNRLPLVQGKAIWQPRLPPYRKTWPSK